MPVEKKERIADQSSNVESEHFFQAAVYLDGYMKAHREELTEPELFFFHTAIKELIKNTNQEIKEREQAHIGTLISSEQDWQRFRMKTYYLILPCDEKGHVWKGQELDEMSANVTLSIALSNIKKDEISLQIVRHNEDIIQKLMERSD